ncbi:hypothetical protein [Spirosoma endbachense]|uniref:Uncharacterized protein n=1 Tax=Spirosoma endbachense TaxID=2666025 RepID=A0A6P1W5U3_9BACT|nr:hypothetical protein [Spirosoma endbachense]QHW00802.1 hypothetical protein GJR95_39810 [Spirosoma endbachense]
MKRIVFSTILLCAGLVASVYAQSNQSPTLQQTTSTEDNRRANPPKPRLKKVSAQEQKELEKGMDTTLPKNRTKPDRKPRRLPPDSLRRGGATRVDTIR